MRTFILAALLITATAVKAADIVVELGSVTVPSAAVADVAAWLSTQELKVKTQEERVDPDDGHIYTVTVITVIPETPKAKLRRIIRKHGIAAVRSAIREQRVATANVAAMETVEALPDPVSEE